MRLYVGNLPFTATEKDVFTQFSAKGLKPLNVNFVRDKVTGKFRGFCFVDISTPLGISEVLKTLEGASFSGRTPKITEATTEKRTSPVPVYTPPPKVEKVSTESLNSYNDYLSQMYNSSHSASEVSFRENTERRRDRGKKKGRDRDYEDDW